MKVGLWGARADAGGLATMTREFYRHVRPARTLAIDLGGAGRGAVHADWYPDATWQQGMNDAISYRTIRDFCDGLDVVYAAETWYRDDFCDLARRAGVRTVLHAMPELYRRDQAQPDAIWVPTPWEIDRMPQGTRVVPVPVARDRVPARTRTEAHTFLFVGAPAFHDRNGFQIAVDAAAAMRGTARMVFTGAEPPPPINTRTVEIAHDPAVRADYWDRYADADVLVIPRRYAGLSLPMQEAASAGLPIVTLDLDPQNRWVPGDTMAHATPDHPVRMVGGTFWVYRADPADIAARMDRLAEDPEAASQASQASQAHARTISWERMAAVYADELSWVGERKITPTD